MKILMADETPAKVEGPLYHFLQSVNFRFARTEASAGWESRPRRGQGRGLELPRV